MSGSNTQGEGKPLSPFFYARPALARFLPERGEILLYHTSIQIVKRNLKKSCTNFLSHNCAFFLFSFT